MEIVTVALSSLLPKLANLLVGEYNLQKGVKGEIRFLHAELESMQGALEKISKTPADQLDSQDKIWARDVRELSYDIEDDIDTFIVRTESGEPAVPHGLKKFIDQSLSLLTRAKIKRKIAADIKDIKSRVEEVSKRRDRYKISHDVAKPVTIDPRILARYEKTTELVGIEESRDELIKILMEGNKVSKQQDKIVSIVGFGGLGKTTLANVVYENLRAQFDCSAFVSVSQTPDMEKLLKDMLYQLAMKSNASINVIDELRQILQKKRYFIVIDDIWDILVWKMIRCALPNNNVGCKIIATTRILNIAEQAGCAYKLKPLSLHNSRELLFRRIFGDENKEECPDEQLAEVSNKILKKCAGVPLAIITIASLLASRGRNKMDWYEVCNSVGTGLENSLDLNNMRKILSLSYYDLPSHMRTCLLYLSVFPEDYKIEKDRLIWMWIAEGFIQCKKGKSLFELGESYFNELINRSMIQPVYDKYAMIEHCCVHDMVLDLICSLSSEENFVSLINNIDHTYPNNMVRRLSLQNGKVDHATTRATRSMQQVRLVIVFPPAVNLMPDLGSFRVLRVLDLEGCDLSQGCGLKYFGNLFHLRYLRLNSTRIAHLPVEIGNLLFLQTLDVRQNNMYSLPSTVVQLRHLICLRIDWITRVPKGFGSLTSLEGLSCIDNSTDIIEELDHLTELTVLDFVLVTKWNIKLVECLCKLQKIQILRISAFPGQRSICKLDAWAAPRHLRRLEIRQCCWCSTLPAWINPSYLMDLSFLSVAVRELQPDDLEILGSLPALRYLELEVDHEDLRIIRSFVIGACSFPCLARCELQGFVGPVLFQEGAMPRLTRLWFPFSVRVAREIKRMNGGLDLGLGNLPSIQRVSVYFGSEGASKREVDEVKASLTHATEIHPNHPTLDIYPIYR